MSTSPRPDEIAEEFAEHVGPEFDTVLRLCRDTFRRTDPLTYLGHFSSGVFDFSLDRLSEAEYPANVFQHVGRTLSWKLATVDRRLQDVRTGRLIRTVVHTGEGALIINSALPSQYLLGVAVDRFGAHPSVRDPSARAADEALSQLSTRIRTTVSLGSVNPGGWEVAENTGEVVAADHAPPPPTLTTAGVEDDRTAALLAASVHAARPADLHVVAVAEGNRVRFMVDHLSHPSLAPFFTQVAVEARRKFYRGFVGELAAHVAGFNAVLGNAVGGPVLRLVLDLEIGALHYYRLKPGVHLVGVTLDQSRLLAAELRLAQLADDLREIV